MSSCPPRSHATWPQSFLPRARGCVRLGSCRLPAHVASLDIELAEIEIEMREPEEKVELEEMMMGETQDEVDLGVMYNGLVSGYEPRDL